MKIATAARSCPTCGAWHVWIGGALCSRCAERRSAHPVGDCRGCGRHQPLRHGQCPWCTLQERLKMAERGLGEQLWLHHQQPVGPLPADDVPPPLTSPAPLPGQLLLELPGLTRDWTRVDLGALPQLRGTAPALEQALIEQARAHRWPTQTRQYFRHVLRIATFHFGLNVPVPEADLRAIAACHGRASPRRLFPLLAEHGMLAPATAAAIPDGHERWVHASLANLPESVRGDVGVWIAALRGQGRRPSVAVAWSTVATYLNFAEPAVHEWATR
ncbi:hypothetical protein ACGFMK_39140 [Amycolatopsis sp. NPDC049252]|uniref:hypothetical protein n=1 Tax=Amycolatopsis sp. NPDC049252 TaxID=3363933 RepID=UPI0037197142